MAAETSETSDRRPEEKQMDTSHVLRREFTHPFQQTTFDSAANCPWGRSLAIKNGATQRRKARPRLHWIAESMYMEVFNRARKNACAS